MAEIRIQTRNSIQSPSQVTNSHKPYQTINREQLDEIVAFVKKRRTRTVLEHEKLDILLLQAKLRYKLHEKQKKVGRRQKRKAAITDHVAHLLQRKKELVGNVWRDYWMSQDVRVARPPANPSGESSSRTLMPTSSPLLSQWQKQMVTPSSSHHRITRTCSQ